MTHPFDVAPADVNEERGAHNKYREMVMREYEGICWLCEDPYADTIDHIVPWDLGGSNHPANLAPAHTKCNSSRGNRIDEQAMIPYPRKYYFRHTVSREIRDLFCDQAARKREAQAKRKRAAAREQRALERAAKREADRKKAIADEKRKAQDAALRAAERAVIKRAEEQRLRETAAERAAKEAKRTQEREEQLRGIEERLCHKVAHPDWPALLNRGQAKRDLALHRQCYGQRVHERSA